MNYWMEMMATNQHFSGGFSPLPCDTKRIYFGRIVKIVKPFW
ncbi:hypothetical protein [Anabaena sp. 4-3]|nr:hypothetical protein [Anabaena sp. 4-3]